MLAAAIGVDRAVEPDVRRLVAGDDAAGGIDDDRGAQRRQLFVLRPCPAVVDRFGIGRLEPTGPVGDRAAALAGPRRQAVVGQGVRSEEQTYELQSLMRNS